MLRSTAPRALVFVFAIAFASAACGDSASDGQAGQDTGRTGDTDSVQGQDAGPQPIDTAQPPQDTGQTSDDVPVSDVPPAAGEFLAPCNGNVDCNSGWCVESETGFVCTKECLEACPNGMDCRSVSNSGGDVTFLCLPRVTKLCVPCQQDFQCNGGACLDIGGENQCASSCDEASDCPDGFTCAADASNAHTGMFCQPESGSCSCTSLIDGAQRTCTATSALGTCFGIETCDAAIGWTGCTATEPVAELCNGLDDDCNSLVDDGLPSGEACTNDVDGVGSCPGTRVCFGPAGWLCQGATPEAEICDFKDNDCSTVVDDAFTTNGVYDTFDHCGACNTSCALGFPNALSTACQVDGDTARCVVEECAPGFSKVDNFLCLPDVGSTCQPCNEDANCVGDGAACVTLDDGRFCADGCEDSEDCAFGFSCDTVPDSPNKQCVPDSNSCSCDGTNTNLQRGCQETFNPVDPNQPSYTCSGFEQCTVDGWGGCTLPAEQCDGLDNDCDGDIDEDFRTDEQYTELAHCGACDISCQGIVVPGAQAACLTDGPVPACGYTCVGAALDVNGLSDDGCECTPQAGADLAGDNVDSNCDGIDGEVAKGIFVAKDGNNGNPGTQDMPLRTIEAGLAAAVSGDKRDVYVATGVYSERVTLRAGKGVFGGYSSTFTQRDPLLFETAIIGGEASAADQATVSAVSLGGSGQQPTILAGFTLFGPNAANIAGSNSYGVYLRNAGPQLEIRDNRIFAGAAGAGSPGSGGTGGPPGIGGGAGANPVDTGGSASSCSGTNAGGSGGNRVCGGASVRGGNGGRADCPAWDSTPDGASSGQSGFGPGGGGSGGAAGWDTIFCADNPFQGRCGETDCGACFNPPDNNSKAGLPGGPGTDGDSGAKGGACDMPAGTVLGSHWRGIGGGNAGAGDPGTGGGGGGSGGGVDISGNNCPVLGSRDLGAGGGGGGSGACAGTGGGGGGPGGGSFGIFLVKTNGGGMPVLAQNTIQRGAGGSGGNGGPGGAGGSGGAGGAGGVEGDTYSDTAYDKTWCASGGGEGGDGGDGGHGGGGGGGCGGASYGIFVSAPGNPPASYTSQNSFIGGGQGGQGGLGGASIDATKRGGEGDDGTGANTNF